MTAQVSQRPRNTCYNEPIHLFGYPCILIEASFALRWAKSNQEKFTVQVCLQNFNPLAPFFPGKNQDWSAGLARSSNSRDKQKSNGLHYLNSSL